MLMPKGDTTAISGDLGRRAAISRSLSFADIELGCSNTQPACCPTQNVVLVRGLLTCDVNKCMWVSAQQHSQGSAFRPAAYMHAQAQELSAVAEIFCSRLFRSSHAFCALSCALAKQSQTNGFLSNAKGTGLSGLPWLALKLEQTGKYLVQYM